MSRSHEKFKRTTTGSRSETKTQKKCIFKLKENWTICRKSRFCWPYFGEMAVFDRRREIVDHCGREPKLINRSNDSKNQFNMLPQRFNESKMHLIFDTVSRRVSTMHQNEQLEIPYDCIPGHGDRTHTHTANRERDNDADKRSIALCASCWWAK